MSLRDRVDPELRGPMDFVIGAIGHDFMGKGAASERRRRFQDFLDGMMPSEVPYPTVRRTAHRAPGPDGAPDVPLNVYAPPAAERPCAAILYIHGGGFTIGSAAQEDGGAAALALETGAVVVSVDYRLAPETPHPGPVEDCYAALCWLAQQAEALGVDAKRVAVYGHSAGGGLAAAVAQIARDRGGLALCYQVLCYPMLDDRGQSGSMRDKDGLGVFDRAAVALGWSSLLGDDRQSLAPYGAAARAGDFARLPPAYIDVGELDVLVDESIDYARALLAAGVSVSLHVHAGAYHGFDMFAPAARVSQRAAANRLEALKRALGCALPS